MNKLVLHCKGGEGGTSRTWLTQGHVHWSAVQAALSSEAKAQLIYVAMVMVMTLY